MRRSITFYSEGVRLDDDLFLPDDLRSGERRGGIVLVRGYTGVKDLYLPDNARVLNEAGAGPVSAIIVTTKGHHHCDAGQHCAAVDGRPAGRIRRQRHSLVVRHQRQAAGYRSQSGSRRTMDPGGEIGRTVGYRAVGAVIGSPNTIEAPSICRSELVSIADRLNYAALFQLR